jgi:hypothetical protein
VMKASARRQWLTRSSPAPAVQAIFDLFRGVGHLDHRSFDTISMCRASAAASAGSTVLRSPQPGARQNARSCSGQHVAQLGVVAELRMGISGQVTVNRLMSCVSSKATRAASVSIHTALAPPAVRCVLLKNCVGLASIAIPRSRRDWP